MRIVSLIASSTEIVWALGFGPSQVGRSHECDFPRRVKRLPAITSPKLKVEAASGDIDAQVRRLVSEGLSVYRVDAEALERLAPDVIVTQIQCEVCAVSAKDVEAAVCRIVKRPKIVSLNPNALADIWTDIQTVADALGAPARGQELIASLQKRIEVIRAKAATAAVCPRVAYIEWIEPLMTGGNWMPELVEAAGGRNLFGEAGKHSPQLNWQEVVAADPDVVVITPCGFDIPRTRAELSPLTLRHGWRELRAVREERVFLADGNQYFNRPGPRVVESLECLAEMLHPDLFRFGHEGRGWEKLIVD